jgi:hypothetical protein
MKALITAFALLSFVAASTIPLAARAQTNSENTVPTKKAKKKTTKTKKVASHKKKSGGGAKMKKPDAA